MKRFVLYAGAILGSHLLYKLSELWYGAEWIFGLLIVSWFGLFLLVWKQIRPGGAGLIFVTFFMLIDLDSVFFLQDLPSAICSLLAGLLLIPFYRKYRDVVLTAMGFVLLNVLVAIEVGSIATFWMLFLAVGLFALIGFRWRLLWLKRCFTVFFAMSAPILLLFYVFEETYPILLLVLASIAAFVIGFYKFSRQPVV